MGLLSIHKTYFNTYTNKYKTLLKYISLGLRKKNIFTIFPLRF